MTEQSPKGKERGEDASQQSASREGTSSQLQSKEPDLKNEATDGDQTEASGEREVTDPVTHIPVTIHDFTSKELKTALEEMPPTGNQQLQESDSRGNPREKIQATDGQAQQARIDEIFTTEHDDARHELIKSFRDAVKIGMGVVLAVMAMTFLLLQLFGARKQSSNFEEARRPGVISALAKTATVATVLGVTVWGFCLWVEYRVNGSWVDQTWNSKRQRNGERSDTPASESTEWLNSFLVSVWGLVNPDLFASLADTLEDSMQANLPKMVSMISVEDMGQGSEAPYIMGVRWLPSTHKGSTIQQENDRNSKDEETEEPEQKLTELVEAEEGNFVSLEVAFAYRAQPPSSTFSTKAKNAHVLLGIYLPGGICLPVWVGVEGILGMVRLRIQLTPDPPFLARTTITFMGQPKVEISCTPMFKQGLNIMNLPIISNSVQASVNAAIAEYVAPKSLTLDIKDLIMADDFKKDTNAYGVAIIRLKRASGLVIDDADTFPKRKSSDIYASLNWTKFGKVAWRTRVIPLVTEPNWDETGFILLGPAELNAQDRLSATLFRITFQELTILGLQVWTTDTSADRSRGFVDIGLHEVMHSPLTAGKMLDRHDKLQSCADEVDAKGTIDWSLGYFAKKQLSRSQLAAQSAASGVETASDLEAEVANEAEKKVRESKKEKSDEIEKQKLLDFEARANEVANSSTPSSSYPSGILAIHVHQILSLELHKLKRNKDDESCEDEGQIQDDDLLSAYCTVILNHQRIFTTRPKPKNAQPTFNVGTERFIRDWRTTEIIVAVRDLRKNEQDLLLGVVVLPLVEVFHKRSQLQLPNELLGWDYGTLQIIPDITSDDLPDKYKKAELKLHTSGDSGAMDAHPNGWSGRQGQPVELALRQRYCSKLTVRFQRSGPMHHSCLAFAELQLKDIPDNEERTMKLAVREGDSGRIETDNLNNGEILGHIQVHLKFQPGISQHHQQLSGNFPDLEDVVEVLVMANDMKTKRSSEDAPFGDRDVALSHENEQSSNLTPVQEQGSKLRRTKDKVVQWKVRMTPERKQI